jgi:uncharacterized protein YndB with AHSA1/START domain
MPDVEPVVREIHIDARPETVFGFFVDAEKLTRWLASDATLDPRPGGACLQVHTGGDDRDPGPFHMVGEYLEVDPPNRVVFTWGFEEQEIGIPPGSTTVEVTLEPAGNGTRLRLIHRDLPAAEVESHDSGWAGMLDRLVRAILDQDAHGGEGSP